MNVGTGYWFSDMEWEEIWFYVYQGKIYRTMLFVECIFPIYSVSISLFQIWNEKDYDKVYVKVSLMYIILEQDDILYTVGPNTARDFLSEGLI
jgi:hypothetical protein